KGGPNHTGSDLGTFGGPASSTGTFLPGTTGHWRDPSAPIADPFATTAAPTQPATNGTITHVLHGVHGCPNIANGCDEYTPGNYPNCSGSPGALCVDANSGNRSSTLVDSLNTSIVQCPGGDPPDPPLPATLNGNILLAPCAGTYGDPLGKNRGILFFLDRRTN